MKLDANGREILEPDLCLTLLGTVPVGRVSVTMDALPVVVPVPFVLADSQIAFPAGTDPAFLAAVDGAVVAFEADFFDTTSRIGWSVLVKGLGHVTTATADAVTFPLGDVWTGSQLGCLATLPTGHITGRRTPRRAPDTGLR